MEELCKIRDIQRTVNQFENEFQFHHGICLNEGMALCSLAKSKRLSSGALGDLLGLTASNSSKVIHSLEKKELIRRELGTTDKRQMFFLLTTAGRTLLEAIHNKPTTIPAVLRACLQAVDGSRHESTTVV